MNWLRVDAIYFPRHEAAFTVSEESGGRFWELLDRVERLPSHERAASQEQVERLAIWLEWWISEVRPELSGCTVFGLHFDSSRRIWLVFVSHRSLPVREVGAMVEEFPLKDVAECAPGDDSRAYFESVMGVESK